MTVGDWVSILNLLLMGVMALFIVPLRRAATRIQHLEQKIDQYNIDTINEKLEAQSVRVTHLEVSHHECLRGLPERFVTRSDLLRSETHRDNQLAIISKQLDEIRLIGAAHTEALSTLKDQTKEIFKRLNQS
jgi:hypothetical protein